MNNNTMKRMFQLQRAKIDLMFETITNLTEILAQDADRIPRETVAKMTKLVEHFLEVNERIDRLRQKNVDNFYNRIRNKFESTLELEVSDEETKEE